MKAIILAGGSGTRLWPMSRNDRPKQFFEVVGDEPLVRDTYRRLLRLFPKEDIYFSISPLFETLLHEHFPEVEDSHIFIEPERRDTGPAMGYVAALLELIDPDEPIVFVPSDHYIRNEELFLRCLRVGDQLIQKTGKLVDIGISPTFPSTVLGYTKIGDRVDEIDEIQVFSFSGHKEKPVYTLAKEYLEEGCYLWHANYYMWTPKQFMQAFEKYSPEIGGLLRQIQTCVKEGQAEQIESIYSQLPKTSIDYAVTEHMSQGEMLVLRGDFGWSDIGAWDTLYDRLADQGKNVVKGQCVSLDTKGSLIYGPADKLITVIGMEDVIVVDTADTLLVCRRKDAQRVKEVVTKLKDEGKEHYL
ncbi:mannose-1-phosphate guanylyltransferase [Patescibacteria group bacterium]